MGVMTRQSDNLWLITSDRDGGDEKSRKRAPRKVTGSYHYWTGTTWSADPKEARTFHDQDSADEYVRANFSRILAEG